MTGAPKSVNPALQDKELMLLELPVNYALPFMQNALNAMEENAKTAMKDLESEQMTFATNALILSLDARVAEINLAPTNVRNALLDMELMQLEQAVSYALRFMPVAMNAMEGTALTAMPD